jgi:hypothetical protein
VSSVLLVAFGASGAADAGQLGVNGALAALALMSRGTRTALAAARARRVAPVARDACGPRRAHRAVRARIGSRCHVARRFPSEKPMSSFAHRPDAVKRGGPISAAGFRLRAALAVHRAHRHEKGQRATAGKLSSDAR